jgi:glyoxylase-like metal-dependent hydrolase (beta-lactamase superfamily II)
MNKDMSDCITALEYPEGIVAIDSGMVRPQMAACYLLETDSAIAVIETGNAASAQRILDVVRRRGREPDEISHVIVTHVHLDHAGGAGTLMSLLPQATLVAHPYGARHVIDPSKLEASARAVYGDEKFDEMYGALVPVAEDRVRVMEDGERLSVGGRPLQFMDAPGHARHHFTIWDEQSRGWFTGDTFGISYRELDSENGAFIFPTTTPIQFDPDALQASIDRMLQKNPEHMYLTHFGRVSELDRLADELKADVRWFAELGLSMEESANRTRDIENAMMEHFLQRSRAHGVMHDEETSREIFAGDVVLNTQGIEFWLDHGRKR